MITQDDMLCPVKGPNIVLAVKVCNQTPATWSTCAHPNAFDANAYNRPTVNRVNPCDFVQAVAKKNQIRRNWSGAADDSASYARKPYVPLLVKESNLNIVEAVPICRKIPKS